MTRIIKDTIEEKNLFREVHHRVSGRCVRNHLDCNGLLTKHQILDGVAQVFLNMIISNQFERSPEYIPENKYVLIGVANSGALIAAHLSYISGFPMLYYVPPHKRKGYTGQENNITNYVQMLKGKKVVLIIGVNHTCSAIESAYDFILKHFITEELQVTVHCVLGIINRACDSDFFKKIGAGGITTRFSICDEYPIEWCNYETYSMCQYGKKCNN